MRGKPITKKGRRISASLAKLRKAQDDLSKANSERIRLQNQVSSLKTKLQLIESDKRAILEKLAQIFELLSDSIEPIVFADAMRNGGLPKVDKI